MELHFIEIILALIILLFLLFIQYILIIDCLYYCLLICFKNKNEIFEINLYEIEI